MKATKHSNSRAEKVRQYIKANPNASVTDMAKEFKTSYQIIYMIKRNMEGKALKKPKLKMVKDKVTKLTPNQQFELAHKLGGPKNIGEMIEKAQDARKELSIQMIEPTPDPVNHPAHYKVGGIETIDFIEAKGLSYHLGNVVKYITRADHKGNRRQDLEKAMWYLKREIEHASATA
jgi:hypothetical protein